MDLELKCPHCNESIFISQINCGIFRHGFLKNNLQQINPHASFEECENYIKNDLIIGCCKPFQIINENNENNENNKYNIIICNYI